MSSHPCTLDIPCVDHVSHHHIPIYVRIQHHIFPELELADTKPCSYNLYNEKTKSLPLIHSTHPPSLYLKRTNDLQEAQTGKKNVLKSKAGFKYCQTVQADRNPRKTHKPTTKPKALPSKKTKRPHRNHLFPATSFKKPKTSRPPPKKKKNAPNRPTLSFSSARAFSRSPWAFSTSASKTEILRDEWFEDRMVLKEAIGLLKNWIPTEQKWKGC